ncbi:hypothetical protein FH972_023318 [Carpinus fangiana]|uniref:Phytochrome n=1 Tax=Carpinus fangiana TaxID=176857 RepID=A0A5N6KV63_9ROSI|nr:hypothetical protein FH972_023318 [Carpinus fangiana]
MEDNSSLPPDASQPPRSSGSGKVPSIFANNQGSPSPKQLPSTPTRRPAPEPVDTSTAAPTIDPRYASRRPRTSSVGTLSASTEGPLSPDAGDRVFPIRSFVSVDPTPTPGAASESSRDGGYFGIRRSAGRRKDKSKERNDIPEEGISSLEQQSNDEAGTESNAESVGSRGDAARLPDKYRLKVGEQAFPNVSFGDASSIGSASQPAAPPRSAPSAAEEEHGSGILTSRFKHIITDGGHHVITGRDGETLQRCEDEPIHIPGAVQSFGALIALKEESEGKLVVRIVSENVKGILGYTPKQLFALDSFTDILSEEQAENLVDHIDFIKDEGANVEADGPEVFTLSIRSAGRRRSTKLWCAIHMSQGNPDTVICEFELEEDQDNPLVPLADETPEPPEDTLASDPTEDELKESTEAKNKPLRVLRSARKRKGEAAAMEVFNIMSQVQEQLAEAPSLEAFLKILVGVVKELTGFHRVMVYQFDHAWNGKVVTELVDPRATKDLYKGLHFPASDIPKQARELYRVNKVRLLYDRDQETARLVCRTLEDLEHPLDLTHTYLRAMSPIHIKYLRNMAVRSSMSISINAFDELWGLISCHAYGNKGTRVSFPIRKMCRLVGDSASRNIERISYASRLSARKLINTAPTKKNPSGYIIASSDDLLNLFDADFGLLSIHDETKILGKLEAMQEALAMLEYLRLRRFGQVTMTQDIKADFPDLRYPPGFQLIAGLLLVPLTARGDDFIVFFRKGQLQEVKWAGNPYEKFVKEGTEGYLEPRKSFKTWSETIVGRSREWTEEEIETAAVLCLVYGKFIEVWRQKEAALQNTQLTKLLLANSAHEVRTPLNAIINYLEIAMEGSLDNETRDNLAKSHSASKSLIYVINDLLDLTKTEASEQLVHEEVFDVRATFREAVEMFQGDAKRKKISLELIEQPGLPEKVVGDQRRVRQAISNITANAIQATSEGGVSAEMRVCERDPDGSVNIEVIIEDSGTGMEPAKLDSLFAELEQAQAESSTLIEEAIAPNAKTLTGGKEERTTLGLGLAVVARIVRNMNGQLRVKSEPGKGSRFVMQFTFDLPDYVNPPSLPPTAEGALGVTQSLGTEANPAKEVTLVSNTVDSGRRSSQGSSTPSLSRRESNESVHSKKSITASMKSGQSFASMSSSKSEADRLIEAIQEPQLRSSMSRSNSSIGRRSDHRVSWEDGTPQTRRAYSHDKQLSTPKTPKHKRESQTNPQTPGQIDIPGSNAPLKAIRMPDDPFFTDTSRIVTSPPPESAPAVSGLVQPETKFETKQDEAAQSDKFRVLVAEDDPINSKIVQKRLQKLGHDTHLTVNGEECASIFGEKPGDFDVVLMDMQMPIVDGLSATKMIRSFEKSNPSRSRSQCASVNGRIPIIAVSASLVEKEKPMYESAGFDAWILKPINFNRLGELMTGIVDGGVRKAALYRVGQWEQGGWFHTDASDVSEADTFPAGRTPFTSDDAILKEGQAEASKEQGDPAKQVERHEAAADQPSSEPSHQEA